MPGQKTLKALCLLPLLPALLLPGTGVLVTGLVGLCFGLFYLWLGRSLLPVIVAHMTVNAWGITGLYLGMA